MMLSFELLKPLMVHKVYSTTYRVLFLHAQAEKDANLNQQLCNPKTSSNQIQKITEKTKDIAKQNCKFAVILKL